MPMPLKCVAIDDEPLALQLIREYVSRVDGLQLIQTFEDAVAGSEFIRNNGIDLLFIDINMPDVNGLAVVRALEKKPMIIFTTAYRQFAFEGFELDAVDYLVKPISFERFSRAVRKAREFDHYRRRALSDADDSLFVYAGYQLLKIPFASIRYLESMEDYVRVHRDNDKPVLTLMTLKSILEKLPADRFRRIHRSYIVAFDHISGIQGRKLRLMSGEELPVSDSYTNVVDEWKRYRDL